MAEKKEKQYVSDNARLMAEWNWEKNNELGFDPSKLTYGSGMKVWWKCSNGHEWQAVVRDRNKGTCCPICEGQQVLKGYNDLKTINPALAEEWNCEKNGNLKSEDFTAKNHKKVWWKCQQGHEWQATIGSRNQGHSCPYCTGRYAVKGETDLQTLNPSLAKEWNYEKNNELTPMDVLPKSNKKVWWKCSEGHEWQAKINDRSKGHRCPYCAGRKALSGFNDLQTINPNLAKEWNYSRNGDLKLEDFTVNSGKKVWWKCYKGHEWQATVANRNHERGCPYCSNQKVLKEYNDLQTINPSLAKEWNYSKNGNLKPDDFTINSGKKVWWKCYKGHEWQATIASRNSGGGCPVCDSEKHTSFPEYAIVYYLKKYGLQVIHTYKEQGYELDVYVPSQKIAIEYDGYYWHKNKEQGDLEKNLKCEKDGIKLYRIREGLSMLNDSSIDFTIQQNQRDLSKALQAILSEIIGVNIDVDVKRDAIEIENLREYTEKENSLSSANPQVAKEWNYEKNGTVKPEYFRANSNKKVWWRCGSGHEWQATIANRNNGNGCPYCSGRQAVKDKNSLQIVNSALAKEWNYEKNQNQKPENFTANSGIKVWWRCNQGHEWQARITDRNQGQGCPYCAGRKVFSGYNDLQTVNPELVKEWDYEKNIELTPLTVTSGSNTKVWWKCSKGHKWQASIANRSKGRGCPYCAGRKVLSGYNDFQTVNPEMAKQWNYEKNDGLTPMDVLPNSNKKVWWKCSEGHEWQARITDRNKSRGCPECAKQKRKKKDT